MQSMDRTLAARIKINFEKYEKYTQEFGEEFKK